MHLTILAADLLPPPAFVPAQALPRLPALDWLLAKGNTASQPGAFLEEALQAECGCAEPVAPLTLLADGGTPGRECWLRADPVHLAVQRDNVQLLDSHVLQPTLDEAHAIAATLNAHFLQDDLQIVVRHDARWYVRVPEADLPVAVPLWRVSGASVFERLPTHSGRINWRSLQNEVAMLLHDHPVNQAREAAGQPAINGLWFWGGGALPEKAAHHEPRRIVASLALARGIALHRGDALADLPDSIDGLPAAVEPTLVVLHQATRALRGNDVAGWMAAVETMHANWFAPAKQKLLAGEIATLTLLLPNESASLVTTIRSAMRRRFWRATKPWTAHA
ncbi:MAG: hypothetical protein HY255_07925 [Betaproteobacteria bacterium]|nr:hypothetical protein [Betaproteobacteria bacterium]